MEEYRIYTYELLDWIDDKLLHISALQRNPNALSILDLKKINKVRFCISLNENAIDFLEKNPNRIDWRWLSANPNAIHLLEKKPTRIDWEYSSMNKNAIHILLPNLPKINWTCILKTANNRKYRNFAYF